MQQYNFQIDHPLIKQERQKDNIIVKRSNNEGCAVIYFSSNGIYFPNDKKTFKKIIMQENKFEWTIVGGESGPTHRYMNLAWVRAIKKQCEKSGVAFFMKQDSGPKPGMRGRIPEDLWIQEFPVV